MEYVALSMFGNPSPGFQRNNHKLSKTNHLNFFLQGVPQENGVRCDAFDAQNRCISWHVYLIFLRFNTENESADHNQNLFVRMMLGRKPTSMVSRKTIITATTCWHDWHTHQARI